MKRKILMLMSLLLTVAMFGCDDQKEAKHIILFIGDGMQLEHEIAASRYINGQDMKLSFHKFPYQANATTWDINTYNHYASLNGADLYDADNFDPIYGYNPELGGTEPYPFEFLDSHFDYFITNGSATDSASAATAMSCGVKTDKGNIAWASGDEENGSLKTIAEELREKLGYSIGVVSTVPFSHATPAAFVSHNVNRSNYGEIGSEIASVVKPDVVIGSGNPNMVNSFKYMPEADYNNLKSGESEYVFVEREEGTLGSDSLKNAADQAIESGKKLFGYYGGASHNFEYPEPVNNPGNPEFTVTEENPSLAACVESTLDVLSQDEDGFFVMFEQGDIDWANHGNNFNSMLGATWSLDEAVKKAVKYVNQPGDDINWSNTLIIVTSDHGNSYMRLNKENTLGKGELPNEENFSDYVTYGTTSHTNELVRVYAKGKGKKEFKKYEGNSYEGTNIVDNTNIYDVIRDVTELD